MILGNLGVETDHPPKMCAGLRIRVLLAEVLAEASSLAPARLAVPFDAEPAEPAFARPAPALAEWVEGRTGVPPLASRKYRRWEKSTQISVRSKCIEHLNSSIAATTAITI